MEKIIAVVMCALMLFSFSACHNSEQSVGETTEAPKTENQFSRLIYTATEAQLTAFLNECEVEDDAEFVSSVYETLDRNEWKVTSDVSESDINISLNFISGTINENITIDSNDLAWYTNDKSGEKLLYSMPSGTYYKISNMLSYYTENNIKNNLGFTPEDMYDIFKKSDLYTFGLGEIYFKLTKENAGDFVSEWDINSWEKFQLPDGTVTDGISIRDIYNDVDVTVDTEDLYVIISSKSGASTYYKITEEIADKIEKQFYDFQKVSEPR